VRFLLVDRIIELESGKSAVGIKNVTMSEDFLTHHFPDSPIMPGALITESLVQLASWIIQENSDFRKIGLAVEFDKIKFHRIVRPGDQLRLEVEQISGNDEILKFKAKAYCMENLAAAAQFSLSCEDIEPFQAPADSRRIFEMIYLPKQGNQ